MPFWCRCAPLNVARVAPIYGTTEVRAPWHLMSVCCHRSSRREVHNPISARAASCVLAAVHGAVAFLGGRLFAAAQERAHTEVSRPDHTGDFGHHSHVYAAVATASHVRTVISLASQRIPRLFDSDMQIR